MRKILLTACIIVGLVAIAYYFGGRGMFDPGSVNNETANESIDHALISVDTPSWGGVVSSPVHVAGKAQGNWFFEGRFPVTVTSASGAVVGEGYAAAHDGENWMTKDVVSFEGVITFTPQPSGTQGTLVFHKDNPSGLTKYDDKFSLAIEF